MAKMVFKRKIYQKMLEWKEESNGSTALHIVGARRVGKSTIVKKFVENEYESNIFINFKNVKTEVRDLFHDLSDLNYIFLQLQLIFHVDLKERKSTIVFDEVQEDLLAFQAIKHLVADGRYDYIVIGSILPISKNVKKIITPSEITRLEMNPMDFEEFTLALGDKTTVEILRKVFYQQIPLGEAVNKKIMRNFKIYMLVGGMPQAVNEYLITNNFSRVDKVKRDILNLYEDEFKKIDTSFRLTQLFDSIPFMLQKNTSRFNVSSVLKNEKTDRVLHLVSTMIVSGNVNVAYQSNDFSERFISSCDIRRFKLFLMDTGLLVTLALKDKKFADNYIYEILLSDRSTKEISFVYENVVAQILKTNGHQLFYYTFPKEKNTHNFGIDFIISGKNGISPIRVKSSSYRNDKSLDVFSKKFSRIIDKKYQIYLKDIKKEENMLYIPIYMAIFL